MTPEEWIIWGYRLLLGREPESSDTVRRHVTADFSPDRFRRTLMESAEFRSMLGGAAPPADPHELELRRLKAGFAVPAGPGQDGFFTDFLGVRTRCSYLPPAYAAFSGTVEQPDGTGTVPLHEPAETVALLRAVTEARGRMVAVELGAGWGPWLVAAAQAARHRGLPSTLVGVEGDEHHFGFMQTHMRDNGIDPADGPILHRAVVGAQDGTALFRVLSDPSGDWGAEAVFAGIGGAGTGGAGTGRHVEVPCTSIRTVLQPVDHADLVHCDIQGAEADALEASADVLDAKVARLVVGTHGRAIEERLINLFPPRRWTLEFERACAYTEAGNRLALVSDGVQVWRNNGLLR